MNVTCPTCDTVFRVDPAKVPEAGVRARCSVCDEVFGVYREGAEPRPSPFTSLEPAKPAARARPQAPAVQPGPASPVAPPRPAAPQPARPVITPPPVTPPVVVRPSVSPAAAGRAPVAPGAQAKPAVSAPVSSRGGRAAINPFLSQDPKQKARRLARALVSDLVVYHPEKRAKGLREGTLKELFDDEIKKSWEEYEDQVGRDLAESTTYFNDALNEILGDGSQIF